MPAPYGAGRWGIKTDYSSRSGALAAGCCIQKSILTPVACRAPVFTFIFSALWFPDQSKHSKSETTLLYQVIGWEPWEEASGKKYVKG